MSSPAGVTYIDGAVYITEKDLAAVYIDLQGKVKPNVQKLKKDELQIEL